MVKKISSLLSRGIFCGSLGNFLWIFSQLSSFDRVHKSTIFELKLTIGEVFLKLLLNSCSLKVLMVALTLTQNNFFLVLNSYESRSFTELNFSPVNLSSTFVMIFASQKISALTIISHDSFYKILIFRPLSYTLLYLQDRFFD